MTMPRILLLIPALLVSCASARPESRPSKTYLRAHEGERLNVEGRTNDTKACSWLVTPTVAFRLYGFRWEDDEVGQVRSVSGIIGVVPEHVAPEREEEIQTDEPAGKLIPERFILRDVRRLDPK